MLYKDFLWLVVISINFLNSGLFLYLYKKHRELFLEFKKLKNKVENDDSDSDFSDDDTEDSSDEDDIDNEKDDSDDTEDSDDEDIKNKNISKKDNTDTEDKDNDECEDNLDIIEKKLIQLFFKKLGKHSKKNN